MITVKEAVKMAREHAKELYEGEHLKNLGLEEAVFDDNRNEWLVTLGYDSYRIKRRKKSISIALASDTEEETLREYKIFRINSENGSLLGMKIRDGLQ